MKATEFAKAVNTLDFMPGWHITVVHTPEVDPPTRVLLYVKFPSRESDIEHAPHGYPVERDDFNRAEVHDIRDVETHEEVYRTILEFLVRAWRHEAREFLRVPGRNWMAPFHPHIGAGRDRYRTVEDKSVPLEQVDR
jgi:hypothetical protein